AAAAALGVLRAEQADRDHGGQCERRGGDQELACHAHQGDRRMMSWKSGICAVIEDACTCECRATLLPPRRGVQRYEPGRAAASTVGLDRLWTAVMPDSFSEI